jgi:hypothetical protein
MSIATIKEFNDKEFYRGEPEGFDDRVNYDEYVEAMKEAERFILSAEAEDKQKTKSKSSDAA